MWRSPRGGPHPHFLLVVCEKLKSVRQPRPALPEPGCLVPESEAPTRLSLSSLDGPS